MKRRKFLKVAGASSLVAAHSIYKPAPVIASKKQRWRLALAVPKTFPTWGPGTERFAKNVEELTDGELKIKVYGAGELVPALGTFEACKNGEIQMGHSAAYYHQGKVPATPYFTSIPFGMNTEGMISWLTAGGGQELWDELMAPHGVLSFVCGAVGYQMTGWFNKEIKTVKDLEGLKIRIPGLAAKIYALAGAKPVLLPGGEVFTSLATGVIDAAEWSDPHQDYILGLHKAAKYYYGASWHEPGTLLELMINKKAWDQLSPRNQTAVKIASAETTQWMEAVWNAKKGEYLKKLKEEGKVKIQEFPVEVLLKLKEYAKQVRSDLAKSSPIAKKIDDSFSAFQERYEGYQSLSENTFIAAARGVTKGA